MTFERNCWVLQYQGRVAGSLTFSKVQIETKERLLRLSRRPGKKRKQKCPIHLKQRLKGHLQVKAKDPVTDSLNPFELIVANLITRDL